MKTNLKRTLALVLTVCMLLSVLPFAASAADYTYDIDQIMAAYTAGGEKGGSMTNKTAYTQKQFRAGQGDWVAILLTNIEAGVYQLDITQATPNSASADSCVVAAIPADYADDFGSSSARNELIATYKIGDFTDVASNTLTGTISGDSNNSYYLLFKDTGTAKKFLRLTSITLTKTGDVPGGEATVPSTEATEPSTEATEPSTTPSEPAPDDADFTYGVDQLFAMWQEIQSTVSSAAGTNLTNRGDCVSKTFQNGLGYHVSFLVKNIPTGVYQLDVTTVSTADACDVSVVPLCEATASVMSSSSRRNELLAEKKVGSFTSLTSNSFSAPFYGDPDGSYLVIFKDTGTAKKFLRISSMSLDKTNDLYAMNGSTPLTSEQAVIDALSVSGSTVKLAQNVNVGSSVSLNPGAEVDLCGFTLSGDSAAVLAISDSTKGNGAVTAKPLSLPASHIALADNGVYRIIGYGAKIDPTPVVNGSDVTFWFRVTLGGNRDNRYALAVNDPDFEIGATISVSGRTAYAKFDDAKLIADWAEAMAGEDNSTVFFRVTIKKAAMLSIDLTPAVNGNDIADSTITYEG